ncbi:alpha/beta hydrolase family protein [Gemmatimonadota bacterium]
MSDKTVKYLLVTAVLALAVSLGVGVRQLVLIKRLEKIEGEISEKVDRIHHLAENNELYRRMRNVKPGQRHILHPAQETYSPGQDTLEFFQQRLRTNIRRWMGLDEDLMGKNVVRCSLGKETIDSAAVVREKVEFYFEGNESNWSLSGYFLYPAGASTPLPAVLCLNGHAGTARAVCGIDEDYTNGYGLALAAAGFAVLSFDWCFEGESRLAGGESVTGHKHDRFNYETSPGRSGLGLYMENALCAFKALADDPLTDTLRLGVTGISRGGELATYFAALFAPRLAACYASGAGFPFTYRRFGGVGGGCECTYVEKIFDAYEYTDLLVAAAPLPFKLQLGMRDEIWGYWDNIEDIMLKTGKLYADLGIPEYFGLDIHHREHVYGVEQGVAFFKGELKNIR